MKRHEFTLGFGIMAADEAIARLHLGLLLKTISRSQLVESMHLEKPEDLTGRDAVRALQIMGHLIKALDECAESIMTARLDDAINQAFELLRETEVRTAVKY